MRQRWIILDIPSISLRIVSAVVAVAADATMSDELYGRCDDDASDVMRYGG